MLPLSQIDQGANVSTFIGRQEQLRELKRLLFQIVENPSSGKALLIRGRRRIGKSRLVAKFVEQSGVPYVFFAATKTPNEPQLFVQEVLSSNLPGRENFKDVQFNSWDAVMRTLALTVTRESPTVVIIDELPYLIEQDPSFESVIQKYFDQEFSKLPVLLIGIGSDLASMEALNTYGRPFYQRAIEMVVPPLSPLEISGMLELDPADTFDAYLITGGLPIVCGEWEQGQTREKYLKSALGASNSALVVSGLRTLDAEFPSNIQARTVLNAIGSGERTFTNIANKIEGMKSTPLARSLKYLANKRVVVIDQPLSTKTSSEKRYRVADPYLRFWLRFIGPNMDAIDRGQGGRVVKTIEESWQSWRGKAIEPLVRESLRRMPEKTLGVSGIVIGGYWTRTNDPEIDIVVSDREPTAKKILAVGSIKWLEKQPFDQGDLSRLHVHRSQLPGATDQTPLIVVSRSGTNVKGLAVFSPQDLLEVWRSES